MARFCANCGTEVDESAVFCPTCGQAIDQEAEVAIPPAPSWPERVPDEDPDDLVAAPTRPDAAPSWVAADAVPPPVAEPWPEEPDLIEETPRPEVEPSPLPPPPQPMDGGRGATARPGRASVGLPMTWPVALSAWLIGVGALVGALGAVIGLFSGLLNPVDLLLLIALLGIATTVFFAAGVPTIPHLRLATLSVVLIGFGVALDRIGFGVAGIGELLLLLGTAAAAIGAVIVELGRDQPQGGPVR